MKKKKAKEVTIKGVRMRIVGHKIVRAGDLVPNELNFRTHNEKQRKALKGIYDEVGFARSMLVYKLPDGRFKLIDGHLRQGFDPDMKVSVEILDVNDEEANKLLATIDPLSALADSDSKVLTGLLRSFKTGDEGLAGLFSGLAKQNKINGDGLSLDIGGAGEITPEMLELQASHVRMMQLFLNVETLPKMEKMIQFLGERYQMLDKSKTDIVFKAVEQEYKRERKLAKGKT